MKETRYALVARDISDGIASGQFPVGSQLPTEAVLCERYGASRHTVRSAMRELQEMGLVSRNKKAGTRVEATPSSIGYRISLASIDDLSQFGVDHVRVVRDVQNLVADIALAKTLGCPAGTRWLRISSVRLTSVSNDLPIGWTDVYVEDIYPALPDIVRESPTSLVSSLIETRYGRCVAEVRQTIESTVVPEHLIDVLHVKAGSPALKIVRYYFDLTGDMFEVSITIHPADRFTFQMRLTRERAGLPPAV
ncbi:MAG TPA: GntR family transcriptional regulator [Telmatospirillum sp.]|nr:GntR family transcriptional regulator [Telmatospirillum sp.]